MRKINEETELFELKPMKYFSFPASYSSQQRQEKINFLLDTNQYIYSLKTDGNWGRMIWMNGEMILQSRTISKKTGNYGELQDKVLFSESMRKAFQDTTILLGEVYLDGGRDRDVGTILRCLPEKAIARQQEEKVLKYRIFDCLYYNGVSLLEAPIIKRIEYLPRAVQAINNKLVSYVKYYEAKSDTFFDKLSAIFDAGGEGVVLYNKFMTPCEGATPSWQTLKVKQEMALDADCFIYGTEPSEKLYNGKELPSWQYWMNDKTGEKFCGSYYLDYQDGGMLVPVTKGFYYNWPGAIRCAVWDSEHNPIILCKCSNLREDFREELRDNYDKWHMCPVKINGMMLSVTEDEHTGEKKYSIRHPKLVNVRDIDINVEDCTLSKIVEGK